jgi:protein-S-isoprenylcysteine O-methyltransferase Ste14
MAKRIAVFTYGVITYAIFFGTFLYACAFLGNVFVPKTIDSGPAVPFMEALLVNSALLGLFALQHSIMARRGFKNWVTRHIPKAAERSTYVLISSICLILLFAYWQPMGGAIWNIQDPAGQVILYALFAFGWLLVLVSTFLINHFDLFGLRQVTVHLLGREYVPLRFRTPGPYRMVRHPLYLGWLFAFWATPMMTAAHLVFAIATTAYILIAIRLEEKDLVAEHGHSYERYRRQVPMLIPALTSRNSYQEAVN